MKIVIDARWIGPKPSGIAVYTRELIRRLPALAPEWSFHILCNAHYTPPPAPNLSFERLSYGVFSLKNQLRLPARLRALKCDVFHSPNFMLPFLAFNEEGIKGVVTIHDVIPIVVPNYAPRSRKTRLLPIFRFCLRLAVRRAAAVITVSKTSRADIIRALSIPEDSAVKVRAIYNGVDESFAPPPPFSAAVQTRNILYVGRIDPYKNVTTLIRAFARLLKSEVGGANGAGFPPHLCIVGPEDSRYPEARDLVRDLGLGDRVTFLGFLDDKSLLAIYREATLLVNPSAYEGFGLPLVEAMRCGVPVVCCDGGAQREITGGGAPSTSLSDSAGAAVIVPPGDPVELSKAISAVLADDDLRRRLSSAGLSRAQDFTWEKTARGTLKIYKSII